MNREQEIILLANLILKYLPDLALAFSGAFKGGATIDDAIAALEAVKAESAQQFLDDAKAEQG